MTKSEKQLITEAFIAENYYKIGFIYGLRWFCRETNAIVNIESVRDEKNKGISC